MTTLADPPEHRVVTSPPTAAAPASPNVAESATPDDVPRLISRRSTDSTASLIGSALAALAFTWLVFEHLLGWSGWFGFIACTWLTFMACYAGVSLLDNSRPIVAERLSAAVVTSGAALVGFALASVVYKVFHEGWPALHHWNFYTQDMSRTRPTDPLSQGGIQHAIVGSGIQIGLAVAMSLPLALGTAVYLTEVGGRFATAVRTVVEAMTALPDILAGLFVYTVLIIGLHWERDGLTVSIALSVTMIPYIARSAEVVLRVVPGGLREASMALGASRWKTVLRVVLPTARSGLATSLILGIARVAGETAPLLIVSGATTYFNKNPLHDPMDSLPLFIWTGVRSGETRFEQRGYGAAALLLILVLVLFVITRILARNKVRGR